MYLLLLLPLHRARKQRAYERLLEDELQGITYGIHISDPYAFFTCLRLLGRIRIHTRYPGEITEG